MNTNAANALLKSLEEPAADTYLILVCHRLHGLPATIRSRCQLQRLAVPDIDQSLDWLDQLTGVRAQSEQLLELAGSRPLLAESVYRRDGLERLAAARLALQAVVMGKQGTADLVALLADDSLEDVLGQIVEQLQHLLRSLNQRQLQGRRGRAAFGLLDDVAGLQRAVNAGANPNRQLLIDALLAKVHRELGDDSHSGKIQQHTGGLRS
jgi:DNA polymerase-3 subunit delta'